MDSKELILAAAAELGITMEAVFIPFSRSRNASEKQPTLNWRVSLARNGKAIITSDYSAGKGHCPAYKASIAALGNRNSIMRDDFIRRECETGRAADSGDKLMPDFADVINSLVSDADVIDYATYEDWASNFGYDPDSRKGEADYRACLDVALRMRAALGEAGVTKLREACDQY